MIFNKTAIVGLGIIGGSLAGALRKYKVTRKIIGITRSDAYQQACEQDLIDTGYPLSDMIKGIKDADLVILAVPIRKICALIPEILPVVKKGCIVTDVGSTKHVISEVAKTFKVRGKYFVGGHPMAGSERHGLLNSSADLFCDRAYAVVKDDNTPKKIVDQITKMIKMIGAKPILIDAVTHDRIVAGISHLPQILSVGLMNLIGKEGEHDDRYFKLSGPAFGEMTRIAESNYSNWESIFVSNRKNISTILQMYIDELKNLKTFIDKPQLENDFETAKSFRQLYLAVQKDL